MARDGNVEGGSGVSVVVNVDFRALMAYTSGDINRRQDERVSNVVNVLFTIFAVYLSRFRLQNCLALVFWFPEYGGFELLF